MLMADAVDDFVDTRSVHLTHTENKEHTEQYLKKDEEKLFQAGGRRTSAELNGRGCERNERMCGESTVSAAAVGWVGHQQKPLHFGKDTHTHTLPLLSTRNQSARVSCSTS